MSQHDMNIANQGFPAFRSDLNAGLAALASLSSGASAPSLPIQYQLWLDTSASPLVLKFYDGSDWISLTSINAGSNTAVPVLANDALSGDRIHSGTISDFASTGIDDNATALRVTVGDSETVINDSGAVHDFRAEGDADANLLFVKAATDKIGIGTATPAEKLQVSGVVRAGGFTTAVFTLADSIIAQPGTLSTGTLSGVTGVDGEFTIRAHTDNKLYFENRTGAALSFSIAVVARHV